MDDPPSASIDEPANHPGRKGPTVRDGEHYGDVVLSLQAGVQWRCRRRPVKSYPGDLRSYSHVEVALIGPDDALAVPSALGLPAELDAFFNKRLDPPASDPLSWRTVNKLRRALIDRCDRLGRFDPS